ncbi:hypothetical protein K2173_013501 [Erythroxylum novogranatense]|uniref:Uncharacterized protein n=1 Tax=Erythroxylum novogranatense TaxID=1862640 RepID=A0AAV8SAK4_9ROSI|nr:hypothetical protein K2173_013501 [Erythroxylum novogranatense]
MPIIQSKGSAPLFCTHNIASFQFRNLINLRNNSNNAEIFSGKGEFDLRSYRMFFLSYQLLPRILELPKPPVCLRSFKDRSCAE